ncbi:hypothetical protein SLEP1_g3194 [Rubroshorea leprosula]|uniref:Uncharacterized protein n=1 Tax=Rubroshorea leprosula TaxID=152421 RepID=A0AAV5HTY6_9ROSI|nr:hypothetical protein SLEP1_g3194 [Rubroshorea leprosula]
MAGKSSGGDDDKDEDGSLKDSKENENAEEVKKLKPNKPNPRSVTWRSPPRSPPRLIHHRSKCSWVPLI